MMTLRQLPPEVVQKLRSGVSITSVCHCVEELVLNSIDAGANCIAVRLNLPFYKIQVIDNGEGIPIDQFDLVGERYATSKCFSLKDLVNLKCGGFRGEALASLKDISAIVTLESRHKSSNRTYCKIFCQSRSAKTQKSIAERATHGTTVTVTDFLYNMPVRKQAISETLDLEECRRSLERMALMNPHVSFSLRSDTTGEICLETKKCNSLLMSFTLLYGREKSQYMKEVFFVEDSIEISGLISLEGHTSKDLQQFYVNKRFIHRCKLHKLVNSMLHKVIFKRHRGNDNVKEANTYSINDSPVKNHKRYGIFVFNITSAYNFFDITFEPRKTSVLFTDEEKVLRVIEKTVFEFFQCNNLLPTSSDDKTTIGQTVNTAKIDLFSESDTVGNINVQHMKQFLTSLPAKRQIKEKPNVEDTKCKKLCCEDSIKQTSNANKIENGFQTKFTAPVATTSFATKMTVRTVAESSKGAHIIEKTHKSVLCVQRKMEMPKRSVFTNKNPVMILAPVKYPIEELMEIAKKSNPVLQKQCQPSFVQPINRNKFEHYRTKSRDNFIQNRNQTSDKDFISKFSFLPHPPNLRNLKCLESRAETEKNVAVNLRIFDVGYKNASSKDVVSNHGRNKSNLCKESHILNEKDFGFGVLGTNSNIQTCEINCKTKKPNQNKNLEINCNIKKSSGLYSDDKFLFPSFFNVAAEETKLQTVNIKSDPVSSKLKLMFELNNNPNKTSRISEVRSSKRNSRNNLGRKQNTCGLSPFFSSAFGADDDANSPDVDGNLLTFDNNFSLSNAQYGLTSPFFSTNNQTNGGTNLEFLKRNRATKFAQRNQITKKIENPFVFKPDRTKVDCQLFTVDNIMKSFRSGKKHKVKESKLENKSSCKQKTNFICDNIKRNGDNISKKDAYLQPYIDNDIYQDYNDSGILFCASKSNDIKLMTDLPFHPVMGSRKKLCTYSSSDIDIVKDAEVSSYQIDPKITDASSVSKTIDESPISVMSTGKWKHLNSDRHDTSHVSGTSTSNSDIAQNRFVNLSHGGSPEIDMCFNVHGKLPQIENEDSSCITLRRDESINNVINISNSAGNDVPENNCESEVTHIDKSSFCEQECKCTSEKSPTVYSVLSINDDCDVKMTTESENLVDAGLNSSSDTELETAHSLVSSEHFIQDTVPEVDMVISSESFTTNVSLSHLNKSEQLLSVNQNNTDLLEKYHGDVITVADSDFKPSESTIVNTKESERLMSEGYAEVACATNASKQIQPFLERWSEQIDPVTKKSIYIDKMTGNSSFVPPEVDNAELVVEGKSSSNSHFFLTHDASPFMGPPVLLRKQIKESKTRTESELHNELESHIMDQEDSETLAKWNGDQSCVPANTVENMLSCWENPMFHIDPTEIDWSTNIAPIQKKISYSVLNMHRFTKRMFSDIQVVGQVDKKFIACIVQNVNESYIGRKLLVLFDQHAVHERIRLEQLMEDLYETQGPDSKCLKSSTMLPPLTIKVTSNEARLLHRYSSHLTQFGIKLSESDSKDIFLVHSVPLCLASRINSELRKKDETDDSCNFIENLIQEWLIHLEETKSVTSMLPKTIVNVLNSQACRGAVKFGDALDKQECISLLKSLSTCNLPFQCAHGRPSLAPILDLDKLAFSTKKSKPQLWKLADKGY